MCLRYHRRGVPAGGGKLRFCQFLDEWVQKEDEIGNFSEVGVGRLIGAVVKGSGLQESLWGAVLPIPNPASHSDQIASQVRKLRLVGLCEVQCVRASLLESW